MEEGEACIEKLADFIEAHCPEGEGKNPIFKFLISLKNKKGNTVRTATDFVKRIFSNPQKYDMETCCIRGFILGQTAKDLIPNWIL